MLLINISTIQTNALKILSEALKEILVEVLLEFKKDSINILSVDSKEQAIVHMKLDAQNFESFCVTKEISVGINTFVFNKIMKSISNQDVISFEILQEDITKLIIKSSNNEKNTSSCFKMLILDFKQKPIKIQDIDFDYTISMNSKELLKNMRDMASIVSETVEVYADSEMLKFTSNGHMISKSVCLSKSKTVLISSGENVTPTPVHNVYNVKYMIIFSRVSGLCSNVNIYIRNNYPVVLKYSVGSLGSIKFMLSPILEVPQ